MNTQLLSPEIDLSLLSVYYSPADLALYVTHGEWLFPKHLQIFNDAVVELSNDKINGLIVCMPPRHGKSLFGSYYVPAWWIGKHRDSRVILSSYEAGFAASWGRKVRNLLQEYGEMLFGVIISSDSKAAHRWDIENAQGGMNTAGAGGAITGKGANLFIIDDPIKNSEEANSQLIRDKLWEWYLSTVETRLEPQGKQLIIQTRWHEDDLAGRLINEINEGKRYRWKVLSFPALCEEKHIDKKVSTKNGKRIRIRKRDFLGRKEGEALWPDRYPQKYLDNLKNRWDHDEAKLGPYWFSALYQQRPTPMEGDIFRRSWFRYYKEHKEYLNFENGKLSKLKKDDLNVIVAVDLATSMKESADYTVFSCWGHYRESNLLFLLDVFRERVSGADHEEELKNFCAKNNPNIILVEAVQYQQALAQSAVRSGLPVFEVRPKGDKLARALSFASFVKAGQVFFPGNVSWINPLLEELTTFPQATHDDFVDTCSIISNHIMLGYSAGVCW